MNKKNGMRTRFDFILLKKNMPFRYFLAAAVFCVTCVSLVRPAVQSAMNNEAVLTYAAKKKLPIYCVDTAEKKLAISFDAAWGAEDTDTLLEILERNDVKATFFLCGYWVDKYPDEVKRIYDSGHTIGNHSNTHPHGNQLSLEQNKQEIMAAHEKIKTLLGVDMQLYRPPFGEYNDTVLKAAEECGYYSIQWDVDSLDWKEFGVEHEINQVLNHKHLGNGSIILFHNDTKYTPDALEPIIKGLKEKGFEIVPIIDLIYKDNYYMDHEGRQRLNDTAQNESTEETTSPPAEK